MSAFCTPEIGQGVYVKLINPLFYFKALSGSQDMQNEKKRKRENRKSRERLSRFANAVFACEKKAKIEGIVLIYQSYFSIHISRNEFCIW